MTQNSKLCHECAMSFEDLFRAVRLRDWVETERREFLALDQEGRNRWVASLAQEVDFITTAERVGSDGVCYLAFWRDPDREDLTAATAIV